MYSIYAPIIMIDLCSYIYFCARMMVPVIK